MYLNKVIILGNLTRDPELKSTPSGQKVVNISLATNRTWKDANGQKQEAVEYHNASAFGRTAENVAQYMKKGDQLYLEGRLQTRSWDDPATSKKIYKTDIIADSIQFGSKRSAGQSGAETNNTKEEIQEEKFDNNLGSIDYGDAINVDDIPF
jgi:single-strand DNA-binding protein